jgi:hypothetical protein
VGAGVGMSGPGAGRRPASAGGGAHCAGQAAIRVQNFQMRAVLCGVWEKRGKYIVGMIFFNSSVILIYSLVN